MSTTVMAIIGCNVIVFNPHYHFNLVTVIIAASTMFDVHLSVICYQLDYWYHH